MTRSQLIALLAKKNSTIPNNDVVACVKTILTAMSQCLENGERIEIRGFGSFDIRTRLSKTGRNPKTGQAVAVPEKRVAYFKAGKELRERVDAFKPHP